MYVEWERYSMVSYQVIRSVDDEAALVERLLNEAAGASDHSLRVAYRAISSGNAREWQLQLFEGDSDIPERSLVVAIDTFDKSAPEVSFFWTGRGDGDFPMNQPIQSVDIATTIANAIVVLQDDVAWSDGEYPTVPLQRISG